MISGWVDAGVSVLWLVQKAWNFVYFPSLTPLSFVGRRKFNYIVFIDERRGFKRIVQDFRSALLKNRWGVTHRHRWRIIRTPNTQPCHSNYFRIVWIYVVSLKKDEHSVNKAIHDLMNPRFREMRDSLSLSVSIIINRYYYGINDEIFSSLQLHFQSQFPNWIWCLWFWSKHLKTWTFFRHIYSSQTLIHGVYKTKNT